MEPNNNMSGGMPGVTNEGFGGAATQPQQPQSEAAMEMQAAIVADQIANSVSAPKPEDNPMVEAAKEQKKASGGKSALIAAVLFAVLAAGGIGFGVWAFMDGQSQKDELNGQVSSLKKQNNDLLDQVAELNEKIEKLEKEVADNGSNSGNGNTNNGGTSDPMKVVAEVQNGIFYIKDENGIVVAQDDARTVTEILSCGDGTTAAFMVCEVVTSEGSGTYTYDIMNKTLDFTLAPKEETEPQE